MAQSKIKLRIRVSWWVKPYLRGVRFFCWVLGVEPNWEKVNYWVKKGVKVDGA